MKRAAASAVVLLALVMASVAHAEDGDSDAAPRSTPSWSDPPPRRIWDPKPSYEGGAGLAFSVTDW